MKQKSNLQEKYFKEVVPQLISEFGIKNRMAVPKLVKVVVNCGIGKGMKDSQAKDLLSRDLAVITGQKPSLRAAKVSIAAFSLRRGMPVGLTITLRKTRMYDFVEKLFSIVLPRLRDFRGLNQKSFDKRGSYTLGLSEHTLFPEIDLSKSAPAHGLEITLVTSSGSPKIAMRFLELMGMPFEKL